MRNVAIVFTPERLITQEAGLSSARDQFRLILKLKESVCLHASEETEG